jgi:hypothetical protein
LPVDPVRATLQRNVKYHNILLLGSFGFWVGGYMLST